MKTSIMHNHLRIHCFQHVPFEDLGCINDWISQNGHSISYTRFYENRLISQPQDYDWLIVMGGPMSIDEEEKYPWLKEEKMAILQAIEQNKTVIGICLGSQLIAHCLGVNVYKNAWKEIGWFDLTVDRQKDLFGHLTNEKIKVFHWHGDTFDLPNNAIHLAHSECCLNQAYLYRNKVLGLQFHFEVTANSIREMVEHGRDELIGGKYVQTESEILSQTEFIETSNKMMFEVLNHLNQ